MTKYTLGRFIFDEIQLESDLITLLSIFNASAKNQFSLEAPFKAGFIYEHYVAEERILQKKLISSAITLRMIDDRFKLFQKHTKLYYPSVGKLFNNNQNQSKNISFRQACNKIVHSDQLSIKKGDSNLRQSVIVLEGSEYDIHWRAEIDIEKYVINGLGLVKYYDDDWDISAR